MFKIPHPTDINMVKMQECGLSSNGELLLFNKNFTPHISLHLPNEVEISSKSYQIY